MPKQNQKNVNEDLSEELRHDMTIHYVSRIEDVLELALQPASARPAAEVPPDAESKVQGTVQ